MAGSWLDGAYEATTTLPRSQKEQALHKTSAQGQRRVAAMCPFRSR